MNFKFFNTLADLRHSFQIGKPGVYMGEIPPASKLQGFLNGKKESRPARSGGQESKLENQVKELQLTNASRDKELAKLRGDLDQVTEMLRLNIALSVAIAGEVNELADGEPIPIGPLLRTIVAYYKDHFQ